MRIVTVLPYQNPVVNWGDVMRGLVTKMKNAGQFEGVEIDIDEGPFVEHGSARHSEEALANFAVGIIKKAREHSESGKYDAIVFTGALDPGLAAARLVSKIPVAAAIHSSVHFASLIGERFGTLQGSGSSSLIVKHCVERYGLGHKLASVRYYDHEYDHEATKVHEIVSKYKKEEWHNVPEAKKIIDDMTAQCIAAIEKDRVDSIIFASEPTQAFVDEVRQRLDEAGYDEIPIICSYPAALTMAMAMVNMRLAKAPRAYPSHALRAKPEYW
ncbi:aspartate/glutamate racemase family protein [Chloroflexota bacterium]